MGVEPGRVGVEPAHLGVELGLVGRSQTPGPTVPPVSVRGPPVSGAPPRSRCGVSRQLTKPAVLTGSVGWSEKPQRGLESPRDQNALSAAEPEAAGAPPTPGLCFRGYSLASLHQQAGGRFFPRPATSPANKKPPTPPWTVSEPLRRAPFRGGGRGEGGSLCLVAGLAGARALEAAYSKLQLCYS